MLKYQSNDEKTNDREGEKKMKKDIQPKYGKATIRCVCGNVIEAISSQGRAAKFMEKYGIQAK